MATAGEMCCHAIMLLPEKMFGTPFCSAESHQGKHLIDMCQVAWESVPEGCKTIAERKAETEAKDAKFSIPFISASLTFASSFHVRGGGGPSDVFKRLVFC